MSNKRKIAKESNSIKWNYIIAVIFSVILIVAPFNGGSYFRNKYILLIAFISSLFTLLMVLKNNISKNSPIIHNYIDIGVIAFALSYIFSSIFAISSMDGLDGLLIYISLFMIYKTSSYLSSIETTKKVLNNTLILTTFIVAIFSMFGAADIIKLNGVFGWGDRLMGLYQYPNATASVLAAGFIFTLIALISEKNKNFRLVYFTLMTTVLLAFLETKSRGGILILGIVWIITIILADDKSRLYGFIYTLFSGIISIAVYSKISASFINKEGFVPVFLIFAIATVLLALIIEYCRKYLDKISVKVIRYAFLSLIALSVVFIMLAFNITSPLQISMDKPQRGYEIYEVKPENKYAFEIHGQALGETNNIVVKVNSIDKARIRTEIASGRYELDDNKTELLSFKTLDSTEYISLDFINGEDNSKTEITKVSLKHEDTEQLIKDIKLKYKFIPDDIAKKINEINLKTESSSERFIFVKDGLKIVKDYPIFGAGYKSWGKLYTKYQSYSYTSREAHNFYLQTAVEAGIVGFIILVTTLILALYALIKLYIIKKDRDRLYIIALGGFIAVLFGHALIDFDFSLYAIAMLAWTGLGMLAAEASKGNILNIKMKQNKIINYIFICISIAVFLVSATMYIGMGDGNKAAKLVNNDNEAAKKIYEKSMKFSYYNYSYLVDYNQILTSEVIQTGDKSKVPEIYEGYKEVEKNDGYNTKFYNSMLDFYLRFGYLDDAQGILERYIEVTPLDPNVYEL
ncbi:MAG: O-antigen ligase family protein, partial [Lutispora sp.]|nr:O-antigen ligase family protein [Lutispora sp.]